MNPVDFTPKFQYFPSNQKVLSTDPEIGLGQTIGGMQVDAQQLSQGKVLIQGVAQRILIGDATEPLTGIGIFMGSDQAATIGYDFRVGDPSGNYMHWDASLGTLTVAGDLVIGNLSRTIDSGDDIQTAVDFLNAQGGGVLYLKTGTWNQTSNITLYSSISIVGTSTSGTIIDFSGSFGFVMTGTNVYTTGTVSINQGSTSITGSGTTFTSAMVGRQIFLSNRWYVISAFGSTTSITIASAFADANLSGSAYRIASVIKDVEIKELTIRDSGTTAISGTDVRDLIMEDIDLIANNKGLVLTNSMNILTDRFSIIVSTSNGVEITNASFFNAYQTPSISSGGHGWVLNNVKTSTLQYCAANSNTTDGINCTTVIDTTFITEVAGNGGQGIEFVSGCNNNKIYTIASGNTSDGIKLTATSDGNIILTGTITGNSGYGINIAASTCDNTVITTNAFTSNSSGAVNDSGTGTVIRGNVGVDDNASAVVASFTAGENLTNGDAVCFNNTNTHAVDFESGSTQYAQITDGSQTGLDITGSITIEAWIKIEAIGADEDCIASKANADTNQVSWFFNYRESTDDLAFGSSANGSTVDQRDSSALSLSAGAWAHVAVTYTSGTGAIAFYKNGVAAGTATSAATSLFNSNCPFRIGAKSAGVADASTADLFDGQLDDVRVWNTAKSEAQILASYQSELVGSETNLQGYWKLNNNYLDETSNNNDLTASGSPTFVTTTGFSNSTGVVVKADASVASTASGFIGFANETVSNGASLKVVVAGAKSGLSSLTTGAQYYLSDTAGAISTSAGTVSRKVGIALSATQLLITNIW